MIISLKDAFKLVGISIVCFCAVFVSTFFVGYYLDCKPLKSLIEDGQLIALYEAQMKMSKFTVAITGGVLSVIAAIMLVFYVRLYIDEHRKMLGVLKALGASDGKIAVGFAVFGVSVLVGTAAGYAVGLACSPAIYRNLSIDGLPLPKVGFHPWLMIVLTIVPAIFFSALCVGFAMLALRRPVMEMLGGKREGKEPKTNEKTEKSFLKTLRKKTVSAKKSLAFFVALACFCFSAMTQMALSMKDLSSEMMGTMIFGIGFTLSAVSLVMAITSLVNGNKECVALLKAFGYSGGECAYAIFAGYLPFAVLGFGVGTVYQYGLLKLMVNIFFKDYASMPSYSFSVAGFFGTLAAFLALGGVILWVNVRKLSKIPVKESFLGE